MNYGFELEGFYHNEEGTISVPPQRYPVDGYPGLVELRTVGACTLQSAWANILALSLNYPNVYFDVNKHSFSNKEQTELRKRMNLKEGRDIRNIYNKTLKYSGNKTLSSLQINLSKTIGYDSHRTALCGLPDTNKVIKNLDEEFASEIKESGRQPGFYRIKNNSILEYRSLPSSSFDFSLNTAKRFLDRIKSAVEG